MRGLYYGLDNFYNFVLIDFFSIKRVHQIPIQLQLN